MHDKTCMAPVCSHTSPPQTSTLYIYILHIVKTSLQSHKLSYPVLHTHSVPSSTPTLFRLHTNTPPAPLLPAHRACVHRLPPTAHDRLKLAPQGYSPAALGKQ
ncbi:hypothetical protein BsWGS_08567 [Bradybaena similaris]